MAAIDRLSVILIEKGKILDVYAGPCSRLGSNLIMPKDIRNRNCTNYEIIYDQQAHRKL